jgi:hypothetical protein
MGYITIETVRSTCLHVTNADITPVAKHRRTKNKFLQMFLNWKEIHRSPLAACERTASDNLV